MQTTEKDPTADIRPTSNLARLFLLRNVIVGCVLAGTAVVRFVSDIHFPMWPTFSAMGLLAAVNIATWVRSKRSGQIGDREFAGQLLADVAVLTVLLFFTGGSTNPLVSLYLLPLAIAATVLPGKYTWAIAAITIACYTSLMVYYVPVAPPRPAITPLLTCISRECG